MERKKKNLWGRKCRERLLGEEIGGENEDRVKEFGGKEERKRLNIVRKENQVG